MNSATNLIFTTKVTKITKIDKTSVRIFLVPTLLREYADSITNKSNYYNGSRQDAKTAKVFLGELCERK